MSNKSIDRKRLPTVERHQTEIRKSFQLHDIETELEKQNRLEKTVYFFLIEKG